QASRRMRPQIGWPPRTRRARGLFLRQSLLVATHVRVRYDCVDGPLAAVAASVVSVGCFLFVLSACASLALPLRPCQLSPANDAPRRFAVTWITSGSAGLHATALRTYVMR